MRPSYFLPFVLALSWILSLPLWAKDMPSLPPQPVTEEDSTGHQEDKGASGAAMVAGAIGSTAAATGGTLLLGGAAAGTWAAIETAKSRRKRGAPSATTSVTSSGASAHIAPKRRSFFKRGRFTSPMGEIRSSKARS